MRKSEFPRWVLALGGGVRTERGRRMSGECAAAAEGAERPRRAPPPAAASVKSTARSNAKSNPPRPRSTSRPPQPEPSASLLRCSQRSLSANESKDRSPTPLRFRPNTVRGRWRGKGPSRSRGWRQRRRRQPRSPRCRCRRCRCHLLRRESRRGSHRWRGWESGGRGALRCRIEERWSGTAPLREKRRERRIGSGRRWRSAFFRWFCSPPQEPPRCSGR